MLECETKKDSSMGESIEAVELNTKEIVKKDDVWIEQCSEINGDQLYWLLLDVVDKAGTDQLYVRRVGNHLEVGVVNKIEIIE